jgi:hypothetical protein
MSRGNLGRPLSVEHRTKIGAANRTGGGKMVRCWAHPQCNKIGLVPRSHIVWEFAHHQFLPRGFVIHHINEVRDDDRIENLALMFSREHNRWHGWERFYCASQYHVLCRRLRAQYEI